MIVLLTIITQIGGLVYISTLLLVKRNSSRYHLKQVGIFTMLYLLTTYALVPPLASAFGRERIKETGAIAAHSIIYTLANRNYVTPTLNKVLENTASHFQQKYPDVKLVHLDANFPFVDSFPLLPHLSHNDGKKIDITFIYKDNFGNVTNLKPSLSGYGVYAAPKTTEVNQPTICQNNGNWQYDFPKYLTFGVVNQNLNISEEGTKALSLSFLKQLQVSKLFIKPHLKTRLQLDNNKVRFHGCQAVRHDDHIHIQIE